MTDRPRAEHAGLIRQELADAMERLRANGVPVLDFHARTVVHTDNKEARYWEDLAGQVSEPKLAVEYRRRAAALREDI